MNQPLSNIPTVYDLNVRVSILERQISNVADSINNINRQLSNESFLKKLIYYVVVGIIYFLNREIGDNVNSLRQSYWWLFNIILCLLLIILRKPILCLFKCF